MSKGLTTTEAADRLSVSPARVRRLVLDGRLPAEKFGRDLVIYEADVEAFERLKGGRPPNASPAIEKRATAKPRVKAGASSKRGGKK